MFVAQTLSFNPLLQQIKMQCSKETIVRLFYNASSSFQLLFLFFYLTSIFLSKLLFFISAIPFLPRNEEEYEYGTFSEEGSVEEEVSDTYNYDESPEKDHLVADIIGDGEDLFFLHTSATSSGQNSVVLSSGQNSVVFDEETVDDILEAAVVEEKEDEEASTRSVGSSDDLSFYSVPEAEPEEENQENRRKEEEKTVPVAGDGGSRSFRYEVNTRAVTTRATSACTSFRYAGDEPSLRVIKKIAFVLDDDKIEGKYRESGKKLESNISQVDKFMNNLETKKLELEEKNKEEIFGDTLTVGSTSKSSSEWRSSINCQDPGYDPFSSSSRRSCPKWESYTVFQKYDEEMLFLDRLSAQKLQETESFRSSMTCPSSISERIVHKLSSKNKKTSYVYQNSYHELEAAYVAQICLTWEALNWNYNFFHQLSASRRGNDPGCPAYIAQQFQQFQVLLQRYIETEPYENGRRPVVYARKRSLAPKLLQVPEYRDSEEEKKDEYLGSRISSLSFLIIMEEAIKTFMNFLRADKENQFQILAKIFRIKNPRISVDPILLLMLKKVNHKKKLKLKDLQRSRKCFRKRRSKLDNEMELLMAQIDLKVVSRVLRTTDLTDEQLHWCEDKMTRVKISDGKLQRDSSPLFFPAH
ncbi:putative ribosomal protein L34Ae [Helianthus annuus]|uniref:Ribosomal protein L34Ae n=1 Tax=Helianthus annuus TaxID=4232 RepID=A0A251S1I7_HELAN|nr:uncharacterized protein LOC110915715 [Helianthus annuus]KAF5758789.1 putative ribosomal protein L34Ae [Helianthus annuus]KAJ0437083.1 hypothetical protein HanHA300_Chr16g0598001 [Helianthus annuus]KAJ0459394.1 hypothetical protein HanHA89_Chr16g0648461 [Helianthus annuus]KAJ0639925.1 hypothetical protein HanLR1_Chr16g0609311 [Helianthus annuus]KAJ0643884.1 hypothetical protein HanOQP8_Chr16g0605561 [Helianthus annuus]